MGKKHLDKLYTQTFYDKQAGGSLRSAQIFLEHLFKFYRPKSAIDIGCGRGGWLKVCGDLAGAETLVGYDGPWNSQSNMMDQKIKFNGIDLNSKFQAEQKFDIAISLEVAEHLRPESSENFVNSMCHLSDVILFGAAFIGQGGTNHINCRYPSYWANLIVRNDYVVFDIFRPEFWGDDRVRPWYRQNTFLYVKRNHLLAKTLTDHGYREITHLPFLDCVHPWLFEAYRTTGKGFRWKLRNMIPNFIRKKTP